MLDLIDAAFHTRSLDLPPGTPPFRAMALVFDGLMVEAPEGADMRAELHRVEAALLRADWEVRLDLKPLHGRQHEPIPSLEAALAAHREFVAEYGEGSVRP